MKKRIFLIGVIFVGLLGWPKLGEQPKAQTRNLAKEARRILKRFKTEPTVREVQKVAIQYAMVNRSRIASLFFRARAAGWLPEFRARYNNNNDDRRSTSFPTPTSPILTSQSTDFYHRFEFRVTWSLDELIFNRNELSVYRELKRLVELRSDILKEVTKLYFERRRLQVSLIISPPKSLLGRIRKMLRLQELVADLDGLTGGYFSRKLKAIGHDPYR